MSIEMIKDKELWDKFIDTSPYGLLFHKWDFLNIIEKHTGYKLLPYGIYKGEELVAIFPLFFKKFKGLKTIFSPPPQTGVPYLGFVMNQEYDTLKQRRKESYLNTVIDEINGEIINLSPNYISISTIPNFLDMRPFKWNGYTINTHYTYVIDLEKSLDNIWKDFDESCRRAIRKSDKYSISLKQTYDVDTFYNIMTDRYAQQGLNLTIISPEYVKEIISTFSKNVDLYFLYNNNDIIDITSNFKYKNKFSFWMGWVNLQKSIPSNEYIAWECIKKTKAEGFKKLEITGAGIRRLCLFKSKFNPSLEICFNVHKKDTLGKMVEWAYLNFIKRRWI